jgi:acyl dehydratase
MNTTYFEDVLEGQEIDPAVEPISSRRLVMWAGAHGDFYHIHYDKDYAIDRGLKRPIVHGALKHAMLGRLVHEWAGPKARLTNLTVRYRKIDYVHDPLVCKGQVKRKYVEGDKNLVLLDVWTENSDGHPTTTGQALVALPSRRA